MKEIDYLKIIRNAWKITWKYKFLWWFGFVLALGGGINFGASSPSGNEPGPAGTEKLGAQLAEFVQKYWVYMLVALVFLLLLILVLLLLKIVCQAGLIKSVQKIISSKPTSFKKGFLEGKKYFWELLLLNLLVSLFVLAVALALFTPVIFLIFLKSLIWALFLGIFAAFFTAVLALFAFFIKRFSIFYLVLSDISIRQSLEKSFELFRKNLASSVIFSLIMLVASIIFGLALALTLIPAVLLLAAIGYGLYLAISMVAAVLFGILVLIIILAGIFFAQAVFETFRQTGWILFFQEIASVKVEEKIAEAETVKAKAPQKVLEGGEA